MIAEHGHVFIVDECSRNEFGEVSLFSFIRHIPKIRPQMSYDDFMNKITECEGQAVLVHRMDETFSLQEKNDFGYGKSPLTLENDRMYGGKQNENR